MYVNITWFNLEFLSFVYKTLKRQNLYSQNLAFLSIYFLFSVKLLFLKIMNGTEKIKREGAVRLWTGVESRETHFVFCCH